MKTKIITLSTFCVIFWFLALNTAWARDPIPKYRSNGAYRQGVDKHWKNPNHKKYFHKNKEHRRFERARRHAWADGRLTYLKMRKLHKLEKKARRDMHRWKHHGVPDQAVKKGRRHHGHHWSAFPKFTLYLSFSDPGTLFAGSFGVK